jgi:hypothetical protein
MRGKTNIFSDFFEMNLNLNMDLNMNLNNFCILLNLTKFSI